ncbi:MAG TPA: hypothetical protein VGN17_01925 [Bryobacteraceae bacterium]|jgi:hypothetical protein
MHLKSTYVLAAGIGLLIALINDKLRMVLVIADIILVLIAAADVFGVNLRIWK